VRYNCKRGERTSLFQPYHSSLTLRNPAAFRRQDSPDKGTLKLGIGFSGNHKKTRVF
jgi:hypothetical protein